MHSALRAFKADLFKALAHPVRIQLVDCLREGERKVGELSEMVGLELANVSQQLAVLRSKNIVTSRKDGNAVYYSITGPEIIVLLNAARTIFDLQMVTMQDVLQQIQDAE